MVVKTHLQKALNTLNNNCHSDALTDEIFVFFFVYLDGCQNVFQHYTFQKKKRDRKTIQCIFLIGTHNYIWLNLIIIKSKIFLHVSHLLFFKTFFFINFCFPKFFIFLKIIDQLFNCHNWTTIVFHKIFVEKIIIFFFINLPFSTNDLLIFCNNIFFFCINRFEWYKTYKQ